MNLIPNNMYCKNCGAKLNDNASVCTQCGVLAGRGNKFCANCGAQPDPLASVCVKCGCLLNGDIHEGISKTKTTMSFGDAISACFRKYGVFSGRASRAEFWWFYLLYAILCIVGSVGSVMVEVVYGSVAVASGVIAIVSLLAMCGLFVPYVAVTWRRLHDTGRSGGAYFIHLIPFVGSIILLVWLCQKSQSGSNEYGEEPQL